MLNESQKLSPLPLLLVAASFGPYLWMAYGVRTEHVLIYGMLPLALLALLLKRRPILVFPPLLRLWGTMLAITLWTLMVTFLGPRNYESGMKVIAHLENYVQPIAIILILVAFVRPMSEETASLLFHRTCQALIAMLVLNSLLVLASVFVNLSGVLHHFVGAGDAAGSTVSARAASMGRYSGVFNQPMESGLAYSLGLLAWASLIHRTNRVTLTDYATLAFLFLGGVISVSKIFIAGGCPLFLMYLTSVGRTRQLFNWKLIVAGVLVTAVSVKVLQQWVGLDFFLRLFRARGGEEANLIALFTAGRFGHEEAFVHLLFARVWEEAPLYGFGFAAQSLLDNAFLEFFMQGGLPALLGYVLLVLSLGVIGMQQWRRGTPEGRLLLAIFVLISGGGVGAPVLTLNRASTVLWVLLSLILFIVAARQARDTATTARVAYRRPAVRARVSATRA